MSRHSRPSTKGREVLLNGRGQIQNTKAARVYVFGESDIVEDDLEENATEMPEIRARRGQSGSGGAAVPSSHQPAENEAQQFFEKEIGEGETLQSLSLKYACPVSELKRLNNLIKDQDFFGLRVLKIPMRRHGYLSEMVKQETSEVTNHRTHSHSSPRDTIRSDSDMASDAGCSDVDFSDPDTQYRIMRTVSIRENFSRQGREASRFLKKMDKDLTKLRQTTVTEQESLDEVISVLTNKTIQPLHKKQNVDGADCGISRWIIIFAAISVAVVVPTVYFVYVKFFMSTEMAS